MKPLKQFVNKYKIRISVQSIESNPNAIEWKIDERHPPNHYKVTLKLSTRQFTTFYTMGAAHCHEPDAKEVIDSLRMEWECIHYSNNFENWAHDLGYDTDSRKALESYKISKRLAYKFARFLGDKLLKELENYERL
jgi:hypothetical protein